MKIYQGWLPKGNKGVYSARGDVELNSPFKTRLTTSHDKVSYKRESNLEQAERGAVVLARRAAMTVSEQHDNNETSEQTHTINSYYYTAQGDALDVGAVKESLGLKRNRKKLPKLGAGFATMGQKEPTGDQYDIARSV